MNMQAVHSRWTGKAFALSRCSDSRDKKTRTRRTKEERKSMVESFIKTYQGMNNGKFPSLNLTHKEVGGSFYTVREIVREIIQDNRVLGPGNINSKLLNFEDCYEGHGEGSISMDGKGHLSIGTLSQPTDQRQDVVSSSTEHRSEEVIETEKSVINDLAVLQVKCGQIHDDVFYNGMHLNSNLANLGNEEADIGRPSGEADDNLIGFEEDKEDSGIYIVEQQILCETLSTTSSVKEYMVNGDETRSKCKNMAKEADSSASGNSAPKTTLADSSSETNVILNSQFSSCDKEEAQFASAATKTCDPRNSEDMEVEDTSFENASNISQTEPTKLLVSSGVDEMSAESQSKQASDDFVVPLQPMLQPDDSKRVSNNTRDASGEQLHFSIKERTHAELEADLARLISNTVTASSSSSILSEELCEEPEAPSKNPFWDAIKSFMSAVVKFWTE